MNMEQALQTYIDESYEMLQDMEDRLIDIENTSNFDDTINAIFRAVHTIKGSAGLFGLNVIVSFTHVAESVLDKVHDGDIRLDEDLVSLMLSCKDHIGKLIDGIDGGEVLLEEEDQKNSEKLSSELNNYLAGDNHKEKAVIVDSQEIFSSEKNETGYLMDNDNWHISVHFGRDVLRNGMDPLSFLRFLGTIGTIQHIITLVDDVPSAKEMDAESCYLGYEINFCSDADKATIESVFEFVREDCDLNIIPPRGKMSDFINVIEKISTDELKLGEILVACGTLTDWELESLLKAQSEDEIGSDSKRKLGELVIDEKLADPEVVQAALNKQDQNKKTKEKHNQTVRVDADKLDQLINLIGELVIAAAGIDSEVRKSGIDTLEEVSLTMNHLVEDVRDSALNLRMVQIGDTFNRFQRVVRDVSKELGKDIELRVSGGDTELDKTVIEKISDPLMHLVRNSIDHGIELPEIRVGHGKSSTATVALNAFHESGSIVIEVTDDGGGLDRERILNKAIDKNLVSSDAVMTDQEIYQLIFEAGFSTADKVSNISGRGVGMDVVRRNIEALRGSIEIESTYLVGTVIRIRLPLTLAIIDGFMVGVGDASYIVPLDIVEECMELTLSECVENGGRNYINLRGEVLPIIRLREHFCTTVKAGRRENIVIVKYGNLKAGFVVDTLMGEFQTVIKPLGVLFENIKGISGSTILGSGEVALILDAPALVHQAVKQGARVA